MAVISQHIQDTIDSQETVTVGLLNWAVSVLVRENRVTVAADICIEGGRGGGMCQGWLALSAVGDF